MSKKRKEEQGKEGKGQKGKGMRGKSDALKDRGREGGKGIAAKLDTEGV